MPGPQLETVVVGDEAHGWSELGFTLVDHPLGSAIRIGNTDVVVTGSGEGFEGWALDGIDQQVAGLPAGAAAPLHRDTTVQHPNGILGIDHIVFHSGDPEATIAELQHVGVEPSGSRSTDTYGAPMRQVFFWLGDVILELIGPDEGEETSAGPLTFFGLALWSDDLDESVSYLGPLAGVPKDAVQPGRRIAGIRGSQLGVATPLALMSPHV